MNEFRWYAVEHVLTCRMTPLFWNTRTCTRQEDRKPEAKSILKKIFARRAICIWERVISNHLSTNVLLRLWAALLCLVYIRASLIAPFLQKPCNPCVMFAWNQGAAITVDDSTACPGFQHENLTAFTHGPWIHGYHSLYIYIGIYLYAGWPGN